jgi:lipopolysaccharide assembly outer membrane protein LptD (OstA)
LYGNPLAKQGDVSMKGGMMALIYDDEEVNRIDINGGASIREAQPDTLVIGRENWIEGDTISLYLHENRVDSIRVLQNAVSEYFPSGENKVESNFVRGSDMFFRFERDSLQYVRILGTASGIYKYVNLSDEETCDSLRAAADSNLTYRPFLDNAEEVVYSAKNIEYFAGKKDLVLNDSAKIKYQNRILSGDNVTYFSSLQMLDARGEPQLVDAGETFYGDLMDYDLDAGSGLVTQGSTQFGDGYYFGEHVAKVGENEMKVWKSTYTTCDLKVPHFHFSAKEMKVFPRDKVVSGPIWLYIGKTPIAYLPFMANSIRRGRRSGILRPEFEFGITKQTGRYVRGFGYYWATNDYTDLTFTGYFNEKSSFNIHAQNRYKLRYRFDGSVDFDFYRNLNPAITNPSRYTNEWKLDARHNHTLGERFTARSDLHFVSSDKGVRAISAVDDVERVIDRSIRSTLNISKRWDRVGFNASASRDQTLNVKDFGVPEVKSTLPNVSLSIPSRSLFFGKKSKPGREGLVEKILGGVLVSPGLSGSRRTEEKKFVFTETISSAQSLRFSSPQKIGFINVQPSLSANNSYTRTTVDTSYYVIETDEDTTTVLPRKIETEENEFKWNTGASMSTNIYGTFYPKIGRLRGIRHVISPSATYRYTPAIGDRPASQGVSVSLRNVLHLKVALPKKKNDTGSGGEAEEGTAAYNSTGSAADSASADEEETKNLSSVLSWNLSSSYDPQAAKNMGWKNVSSAVNLDLYGTRVSMTQSFEPYDRKLLSTSITTGFALRGDHPFGFSRVDETEELNVVAAADTSGRTQKGARDRRDNKGENRGPESKLDDDRGLLPWSFRVDLSYSKYRHGDTDATMRMSGNIDLTPAWKISYSTSYDVVAREFRSQNYSITRDLHCWEMSFTRRLYGNEWQYYFKINLRAHPEIYAENGLRGIGGMSARTLTSGRF